MDDASVTAAAAAAATAATRRTPPPAVGSPAARRAPATPSFSAPRAERPRPSEAPHLETAHAATAHAAPAPALAPTRAAPPPASEVSNIELVLSTGERLRVAGRGIIGRDPSEAPGAYSHRLALADTDKLLSRAHLEFGLDAGSQFWISDLHSTNGVVVERVDQPPQRCLPGYRVVVQPGERVIFGGRVLTLHVRL